MEPAKHRIPFVDLKTESPAGKDPPEKAFRPSGIEPLEREEISKVFPKAFDSTADENRLPLSRAYLVNKINLINFFDRTVILKFKHAKYDRTLTLDLKPQPCQGDRLYFRWPPESLTYKKLLPYQIRFLLINDGKILIRVEAKTISLHETGLCLQLPEICHQYGNRKMSRHAGRHVDVQMIQSSSLFRGTLLDFNAVSLRVELKAGTHQAFEWINPENSVSVILSEGPLTYYSGECKILRRSRCRATRRYVLEPIRQEINRYRQKEFRSDRVELTPSPDISFTHPLTKKRLSLKVIDLSGSGFSVEEDERNSQLITGLIIPELELRFADNVSVKCKTQVVYRKVCEEEKLGVWTKSGLAILDMDLDNNVKLLSLLHQANNRYSYICNNVDLNELWDFFFETGFIYPDKYVYIEANKEHIKNIYKKLYTQSPGIARHFIYQEKGTIMGHMAMVRFYENSWLIQHHAARKSALNKAGLIVLKQIGHFINDSYRLNAIHLRYVIMYYRPDNKFPSRIFGGAAEHFNDRKCCSIDPFAYTHIPVPNAEVEALPDAWELIRAQAEDLTELADYYESESGGLMLNALDLEPEQTGDSGLEQEYRRLGFKKAKHIFALKAEGLLKAIILVNVSDIGLNLSNLTNCLKFIVLDKEELTAEILTSGVQHIYNKIGLEELTVLGFPVAFADAIQLPYEKVYNMWVMNTRFSDPYFRYLQRLLKHV